MNQMTPSPIQLIPETAPFSPEQRAWLNGFLAGLVSLDGSGVTPLSAEQGAAVMKDAVPDGDDGEAPWHDQTLQIAERMKLAEGRPLRRRMMAAMAQQDCGQCGYNCNDYSEVIASRQEARLNLCVPGGKETARMLKSLFEELESTPAAVVSIRPSRLLTQTVSSAGPIPRQPGDGLVCIEATAQQGWVGKRDLACRVRFAVRRARLHRRRLVRRLCQK